MGPVDDEKLLSRMLFESRELISMLADVVEGRTGQTDDWSRRVVADIDAYRAERGWSPNGFGDEKPEDDWWTTAEVASHLGVTTSTLRAYKARRQMPLADRYFGRTAVWRPGTIRTWQERMNRD